MKQPGTLTDFFDKKIRELESGIAVRRRRVEALEQELQGEWSQIADAQRDLEKAQIWKAEAVATIKVEPEEDADGEDDSMSLKRRVELYVESLGPSIFTPKDVIDGLYATGLRFREGAVHTILQRLETSGTVVKMSRGSYRPGRTHEPRRAEEQLFLDSLPESEEEISDDTTAEAE